MCGLCIDACDTVMKKVGRPSGLIAYDTDLNVKRRLAGQKPIYRIIRARTVIYLGIIAVAGLLMLYTLATRSALALNVLHDRNPLSVALSDGSVRNAYTIHFLNKLNELRTVALEVDGLPNSIVHVVGSDIITVGPPLVALAPDQTREVRVLVTVPAGRAVDKSTPVVFRTRDVVTGETATAQDHFIAR
jgi:polyferredoxin